MKATHLPAPNLRLVLAIAAAPGFLLLVSCGSRAKDEVAVKKPVTASSVIELPRGTIAAVPGSPEDALARFMVSNDAPPRTFRFNTDEFAPWSDQFRAQARGTLATVILILTNYPDARISLAGYTDNVGSADANLALSQHRADMLKRLLVEGGVAPTAIAAIGKGMADPIGDNNTLAGRARNRRIELTVTAKD